MLGLQSDVYHRFLDPTTDATRGPRTGTLAQSTMTVRRKSSKPFVVRAFTLYKERHHISTIAGEVWALD